MNSFIGGPASPGTAPAPEHCPLCEAPAVVTQRRHSFGCYFDGDVVGREEMPTENIDAHCTCKPSATAWRYEPAARDAAPALPTLEEIVDATLKTIEHHHDLDEDEKYDRKFYIKRVRARLAPPVEERPT